MIFKNLFRRRGRTALTILGISVGVSAIIALGALNESLRLGYGSVLTGSEADFVLRDANSVDLIVSSVDEEIGPQLAAMPEVSAVSGMIQGLVQAESALYFFVFGYPEGSFALDRFQILDGVGLYSREADAVRGQPVIIGSAAAEAYNVAVGGSLRIGESAYRVVGIYETGEAFEDGGAVLRLSDAQVLLGLQRQVSAYYIQVKDPALSDQLTTRITRQYPELLVSSPESMSGESSFADLLGIIVSVIGGLTIVIGGIAMMNAQLMSVFERTREIGVLRALGWRRWRVLLMVLGESIVVGFWGGLVGIGLASLVLSLSRDAFSAFGATGEISPQLLRQALMLVLLLGVVGGLYPAVRAAGLRPVEALRYEGGTMGARAARLPVGGLAVQNLWQRKARTFLTLAVIAITIGATLTIDTVLGSTGDIFSNFFGGAEVAVREADVANVILSVVDEKYADRLAAMPEVRNVSGVLLAAQLSEEYGLFILQGHGARSETIEAFNLIAGERITGSRQIMLGNQFATTQNLKVGDTLNLAETRLRVVGIYEHTLLAFEMGGVISLREAQRLAGYNNKVTFISVSVHEPLQAEAVVQKINAHFPELHASLAGDFAVESPNLQSANIISDLISVLSVVVGGIGMMNTMLMSTLERTREIGVLRALGWRRRAILALILRESIVLGVMGGIMGIVISVIWVNVLGSVLIQDDSIQLAWTFANIVRALVISLSLALAGGLYPALRASGLKPVEALQYE